MFQALPCDADNEGGPTEAELAGCNLKHRAISRTLEHILKQSGAGAAEDVHFFAIVLALQGEDAGQLNSAKTQDGGPERALAITPCCRRSVDNCSCHTPKMW